MAVYAIGDIQGCYREFRAMLEKIAFDAERDHIWLTGDLVNRGPRSLEVLRLVRELGEAASCVLGNHDLHLIGRAAGIRRRGNKDTLDDVLRAPDRDELIDWLRRQPLLRHDKALGWTMVHAGLAPQWDLETARGAAQEIETGLRSDDYREFLASLSGAAPNRWHDDLGPDERRRFTVNCLTRLRYCRPDGRLALGYSGRPGTQPKRQLPWFEVPGRKHAGIRIIFGHWSTLGPMARPDLLALDGGCVWGHCLAAARIDTASELIRLPCGGYQRPAGGNKQARAG